MIKIISDSTCDLSEEIVDKYNIDIIPLTINMDGIDYRDRIDVKPDEFYKKLEELNQYSTTSTPSPSEFIDSFKRAVNDGHDEILCICMSSGTSGTYQSAALAATDFKADTQYKNIKIHVVDTKCMSHGSGWLILKSARLREQGATYDELVEFNESYKKNVKHFLSVEDLGHLVKSGRLTNTSAFVGKILRIMPIMSMKNGRGAIVAKVKGRKKMTRHYIEEFKSRIDNDITDFVIIGYTSELSLAEDLKARLITDRDFNKEIFIMQMGVVVGNHVGLRGVSMYFVEKDHLTDNLLINEWHKIKEKKDILVKKIKAYEKKFHNRKK